MLAYVGGVLGIIGPEAWWYNCTTVSDSVGTVSKVGKRYGNGKQLRVTALVGRTGA